MNGRMLVMPIAKSPKTRSKVRNKQILLLYAHSGSLEQIAGLASRLSDIATVTAPDLPGHGGMDSLFKVGMRPDMEGLASYLAAFIKLRYHSKMYTIVALWSSVPLITYTLQRYPELQKNVQAVVSLGGIARFDDLKLDSSTRFRLLAKSKFAFGRSDVAKTQLYCLRWLLNIDVCNAQLPIELLHLACNTDSLIDNPVAEQHLSVVFKHRKSYYSSINFRLLSASGTEAKLPPALLRQLASQ